MELDFTQTCLIPGIQGISDWMAKNQPFQYSCVRRSPLKEPHWYIASIQLARAPIGIIHPNRAYSVAGSSIYKDEAITSCLGEAIERYCAANSYLVDQPTNLEVDPSLNFVRCASWEDAPESFKEGGLSNIKIPHTEIQCLNTTQKTYMPVESVFLADLKRDSSTLFSNPISTGLSFFINKEMSIVKGVLEVIERDALMRWWYTDWERAQEIDISSIFDTEIVSRLSRIWASDLSVKLLNISSFEQIPVILCMIYGKEYPYAGFGISCNTDISKAISKSIDEAISIRAMAYWSKSNKDMDFNDFSWITELPDHMHLYANWKDSPAVNQIIQLDIPQIDINTWTISLLDNDPILLLRNLIDYLQSYGYEVYYKDLTLPEVKYLGFVSKVIIPRMIPLSQSENIRWLGSLYPDKTEFITKKYPHPFA